MKISVITVCYNSEKMIENTIKSVLSQTYENIEYIIIDGGSSDNTIKIIEKYRNKIDYLVSEPDSGMYNAMNKGIKAVCGDWLFFLNSDDEFYANNSLEKAAKNLWEFKGDILLSDIFLDHSMDADVHNRILSYKNLSIMNMYFIGLYQQAIFFNKNVFNTYGFFDENYKIISDVDWVFKNHKKLRIKYVPEVYCKFLAGGLSAKESEERTILKNKYINKDHAKFYEFIVQQEKFFHWFCHKYFRSLARNEKVAGFVRDSFWSSVNTIMGWKVKMIKD